MTELNALGLELQARRTFCDDAVAFLNGINAIAAFEDFRKARHAPKPQPHVEPETVPFVESDPFVEAMRR